MSYFYENIDLFEEVKKGNFFQLNELEKTVANSLLFDICEKALDSLADFLDYQKNLNEEIFNTIIYKLPEENSSSLEDRNHILNIAKILCLKFKNSKNLSCWILTYASRINEDLFFYFYENLHFNLEHDHCVTLINCLAEENKPNLYKFLFDKKFNCQTIEKINHNLICASQGNNKDTTLFLIDYFDNNNSLIEYDAMLALFNAYRNQNIELCLALLTSKAYEKYICTEFLNQITDSSKEEGKLWFDNVYKESLKIKKLSYF